MRAFGDAQNLGFPPSSEVAGDLQDIESTSDGDGYWIADGSGNVFEFGSATHHGDAGAIPLNEPIVGMAPTVDDDGYWLVASDGGVFSYGSAEFEGSMGGTTLNQPIVGMSSTDSGEGYWLVAADGGIFAFGDAQFLGSAGDIDLGQPITNMGTNAFGSGYWLVGADGGVFTYGVADFLGSLGSEEVPPVVDLEPTPTGDGYWLLSQDLQLTQRCEGNGYEVSFPTGWWVNDGDVAERCSLFAPEAIDVPDDSEATGATVRVDILSPPLEMVVDSVNQNASAVLASRDDLVDDRATTVVEYVTGQGLLPSGTSVYGYFVSLFDGRTLMLQTTSLVGDSFDTQKALVDEMADTVDLLVLNISTAEDIGMLGARPPGGYGTLVDARLGRAPGFDRFVLELDEDFEPAFNVQYIEPPARRPGSGFPVDVEGSSILRVNVFPVRRADISEPGTPLTYTGPERFGASSLGNVNEAVFLGDFEALTQWVLGVDQRSGFRAFLLDDPTRLVVDVNH